MRRTQGDANSDQYGRAVGHIEPAASQRRQIAAPFALAVLREAAMRGGPDSYRSLEAIRIDDCPDLGAA